MKDETQTTLKSLMHKKIIFYVNILLEKKIQMNEDKVFVGLGDGSAFGYSGQRYVFDLRGKTAKFLNENGTINEATWDVKDVLSNIERGVWKFITKRKMKSLFPRVNFNLAGSVRDGTLICPPTREKATELKKSALYFNSTSARIERVITIQDKTLIWTSSHKEAAKPYPRSAFYIASKEEVQKYLEEAGAND